MNLWYDSETYSTVPISHGTGAYVVECELMLATYAIDDGPVGVWQHVANEPMPRELYDGLKHADTITAHNSFFDRSVLNACGFGKYYDLSIPRFRCVMAQALAHGLPGGLDKLGEVFNLDEDDRKVKEGRQLIHLFCKPHWRDGSRATHVTHPEEWTKFVEYAKQDVVAMREIARRLPTWNYPDNRDELESWFRDQERNDHGILVDLDLCHAARRAMVKAKRQHSNRTHELTEGHVDRTTQRDKLLAYILLEHNVDLPDMRAATLERRLNDPELPETVKELIRIRLEAAMNSQTKYRTAIRAASPDGRVRGTIQWCGASRTGRDAGRIVQPQNFPRPSLKNDVIERGIRALKLGAEDLICA